ncbi:MAG: hypothetical protein E6H75_13220, partial [Betaproteobacteria bacterium]
MRSEKETGRARRFFEGGGKLEVAVIGGGIGGLTLALYLHANGVRCRVYEAAAE